MSKEKWGNVRAVLVKNKKRTCAMLASMKSCKTRSFLRDVTPRNVFNCDKTQLWDRLNRTPSAETVQICLTSILLNGFALYILRYTHWKFSYADKFWPIRGANDVFETGKIVRPTGIANEVFFFFTCEKKCSSNQKPLRVVSFAPSFPPLMGVCNALASR